MAAGELFLPGETATERLGRILADALGDTAPDERMLLVLSGELGTGKSTLARAMLRALGVHGPVRSPTYTLAEPYTLADGSAACHLDLYRLGDEQELEFLGFRDLLGECRLLIVEWPERAPAVLAMADLHLVLEHAGPGGRLARVHVAGNRHAGLPRRLATEFPAVATGEARDTLGGG
jgi:tRNA threonylcarbamoyladenosine biosynthesis protein TsaE